MNTRRRNSRTRFLCRVGLSVLLVTAAESPLSDKLFSKAHAEEEPVPTSQLHPNAEVVALADTDKQCEAMPPGVEMAPELLALADWPLDPAKTPGGCASSSETMAGEIPLPAPIEINVAPVVRVVASGFEPENSSPVAVSPDPVSPPESGLRLAAMAPEDLDEIRGGFELPDMGLKFTFGIERAVYINNELVASTVLNVSDIKATVANSVPTVTLPNVPVVNLPGNAGTGTSPVSSAGTPTGGVPASLPGNATATGNAQAPATNGVPPTSLPGVPSTTGNSQQAGAGSASSPSLPNLPAVPPILVQNGTGNGISVQIAPNLGGTFVQNTLNDQQIKTVTTINAAINSAQVLRALSLQSFIRDGIVGSLRR